MTESLSGPGAEPISNGSTLVQELYNRTNDSDSKGYYIKVHDQIWRTDSSKSIVKM